jgi:hypothetical protein
MILETIFTWVGGITLILICISISGGLTYWIFNSWSKTLPYMWRVCFMAFQMSNGKKNLINQEMTDKDGTKFKLIEIKKDVKEDQSVKGRTGK